MNNKLVTTVTYSHPAVEKLITDSTVRMLAQHAHRGKTEAEREQIIQAPYVQTICINSIQEELQGLVYGVLNHLPIGKSILNMEDFVDLADRQISQLTAERHEHETEIIQLAARNQAIKQDAEKTKLRRWQPAIVIPIIVCDCLMAFGGFITKYTVLFAGMLSLSLAALIAVLPIPLSEWIMKVPSYRKKIIRFCVTTFSMGIIFLLIAIFRADAASGEISITVETREQSGISFILIGGVSTFFFAALLGLKLYLYRTPNDKLLEKEHVINRRTIQSLEERCKQLLQQTDRLAQEKIEKRDSTRAIYTYRDSVLKRIKNLGKQAYCEFVKAYSIRRGETPNCLLAQVTFTFDENDPFKTQK